MEVHVSVCTSISILYMLFGSWGYNYYTCTVYSQGVMERSQVGHVVIKMCGNIYVTIPSTITCIV